MNEIVKLVDKVLPLEGAKAGITYNESQSMLVTTGLYKLCRKYIIHGNKAL